MSKWKGYAGEGHYVTDRNGVTIGRDDGDCAYVYSPFTGKSYDFEIVAELIDYRSIGKGWEVYDFLAGKHFGPFPTALHAFRAACKVNSNWETCT